MQYTEQEKIRHILNNMYPSASLPPDDIILKKNPELIEDGIVVSGSHYKKYKLNNVTLTTILDSFYSSDNTPQHVIFNTDLKKGPAFIRNYLGLSNGATATIFMTSSDIERYHSY